MARLDGLAIKHKNITSTELMHNAATALFTAICDSCYKGGKILILCGAGNNGGDGYALAGLFADRNIEVCICNVTGKVSSADAKFYYDKSLENPFVKQLSYNETISSIDDFSIVVDSVVGTGFYGEFSEEIKTIFRYANRADALRVAVDMPSGVHCDTAEVAQDSFKADTTITFEFLKPGLVAYPGKEYSGAVKVVDIGFAKSVKSDLKTDATLLTEKIVGNIRQPRIKNSNKGNFGKILSVCGSEGMVGAPYFCAAAALRSGIGLLYIACTTECLLPLQLKLNEPVFLSYNNDIKEVGGLSKYDVIVHGCGCGQKYPEITEYIIQNHTGVLVLDADALNIIAEKPSLLKQLKSNTVLTPHPGEMARLVGCSVAEVQSSRIVCAVDYAKNIGCYVVLKGSTTVIAAPDGRYAINPTGNPGMAKGGSGDILAGMIAGYCGSYDDIFFACCAAVYEHGAAADRCLKYRSEISLLPTDILAEINNPIIDKL